MNCIFELIITNHYPIVVINGKKYLIDTGLPRSCSFDSSKTLKIEEDVFPLSNAIDIPKEEMLKTFNMEVNGFLGLDIIKKYGNCLIDKRNNKVIFGICPDLNETKVNTVNLDYNSRGDLLFKLKFNDRDIVATLDTGANRPMVFDKSLLIEKNYVKMVEESSNNGLHYLRLFNGSEELCGKKVGVEMLEDDGTAMGNDSPVIMGIDQLVDEYYFIDIDNMTLYFK